MLWTKIKLCSAAVALVILMFGGLAFRYAGGAEAPAASAPATLAPDAPVLKWSDAVSGLRAAIELTQNGPVIHVRALVKNETAQPIQFQPGRTKREWHVRLADKTPAPNHVGRDVREEGDEGPEADAGNFGDPVTVAANSTLVISRLSYVAAYFDLKPASGYTITYDYNLSLDTWGSNREASPEMIKGSFAKMERDHQWTGKISAPPVTFDLPLFPAGSVDAGKSLKLAQEAAEAALNVQYLKNKARLDQSKLPGKEGAWISGSKVVPTTETRADGWSYDWYYTPNGGGVGFSVLIKVEPSGKTVVRRCWCN